MLTGHSHLLVKYIFVYPIFGGVDHVFIKIILYDTLRIR